MTWEHFNYALPNLISSSDREFFWQKIEKGEIIAEILLSNIWHHATLDNPKFHVFNGEMTYEEFMSALPPILPSFYPNYRKSLWKSIEKGESSAAEILYLLWSMNCPKNSFKPETDFKSKSTEPEPKVPKVEAPVDKSSDEYLDSNEFWESEYSHQAYVRNMKEAQKK